VQANPSRILIVEDDPPARTLLRELLESEGYRVECAGDGLAALFAVQAGEIALVLLDLRLPYVDGLRVCRLLRRLERGAHLPVILATAAAGPEQRAAALAAGATDYLAKPFTIDALLACVRACLQPLPD
jgi:DNA-binding response OmpR family regulator